MTHEQIAEAQNLAREWALYGVRVNAIRPGFFPTDWSKKHFIDSKRKTMLRQDIEVLPYLLMITNQM